jgi:hypothetical protein
MRILFLAFVSSIMLLTTASAGGNCTTTEPTLTLETHAGTYYVQNDLCQPGCLFSVWVYEESNGEPGLQRGDALCNDDGTCCDSDTIWF